MGSFLDIAPESPFPLQNLPYGVFSTAARPPRVGVAVGEWVVDLAVLAGRGLLPVPSDRAALFNHGTLRPFMLAGPAMWQGVRAALTRLLSREVADLRDDAALRAAALVPQTDVRMHLPCEVGGYTDFYCSEHHARNVGTMFRGPDKALPAHFKWLPIAYNGRASTVVVSGTPVQRPRGQFLPLGAAAPEFGPTQELDFELEVGVLIGVGNAHGAPIPVQRAWEHVFGFVLVNDWSARDIQRWEYQPLGPFNGKSFATTISPWVVPTAALLPLRCSGPEQVPAPLAYLRTGGAEALNLALEATLTQGGAAAPATICRTNFREQYWSFPQIIAHHTSNGCALHVGDLLASGTVSGPSPGSLGCLLEAAWRGERPLRLPDGEVRTWLADGDTVTLSGFGVGSGYRVGFGTCTGQIVAATD